MFIKLKVLRSKLGSLLYAFVVTLQAHNPTRLQVHDPVIQRTIVREDIMYE